MMKDGADKWKRRKWLCQTFPIRWLSHRKIAEHSEREAKEVVHFMSILTRWKRMCVWCIWDKAQNVSSKSFHRVGIYSMVCKLACLNMLRSATALLAAKLYRRKDRGTEGKKKKWNMRGWQVTMEMTWCNKFTRFHTHFLGVSLTDIHTTAFIHAM